LSKQNNIYEGDLEARLQEVTTQLNEANDIIDAIRKGEVDAFIVRNDEKHEVYTLQSADRAYRIFIEKMNEGALTLDKDGNIIYSNSSFAELINTPLENVIGLPFINFIPGEFKKTVNHLIRTAWEDQECKGEILLSGKGKPVPVLLSMNLLEIDGGIALSIIITDITLQKETLQHKKAMEKKDEFISIASHELKTPVTSIKGYVQLLRYNFQKEGNGLAADLLTKVDLQINKLTNLIGDLLDVKKIENGQLQYKEETFDFNMLVNEIIEETQRVLNNHMIDINLSGSVSVFGDRNKLEQVITNLLENAGKYSKPGSPISVSSYIKDGNLRLDVKDSGIGIPKNQIDKIFERFFRVSSETENTYSGLGLGLYISAEIIKRHNGKIGVTSEEGKGSTFYFEIPVPLKDR
jgi:PAS domain S-box-containing protein